MTQYKLGDKYIISNIRNMFNPPFVFSICYLYAEKSKIKQLYKVFKMTNISNLKRMLENKNDNQRNISDASNS